MIGRKVLDDLTYFFNLISVAKCIYHMYMHAKGVQICTIQLFQGPKNTIITNSIGTLFYGVEGRVYIIKTWCFACTRLLQFSCFFCRPIFYLMLTCHWRKSNSAVCHAFKNALSSFSSNIIVKMCLSLPDMVIKR